jgi:hypothetical protein
MASILSRALAALVLCASLPAPALGEKTPAAADDDEEAAPAAATEPPVLHPFLVVVGGLNYDHIINRPAREGMTPDQRRSRLTTLALSRFGLEGYAGPNISVRSELELAAGPHGTSVWEGQAAITVRDQYLRLAYDRLQLDVGRITDPASIDFYSLHVANLLLTDFQLRLPFLASGANRGNGVLVRYRALPGLHLGLTVNAGNPVSNTGTAMLGGTYPPFSRFYHNIVATVRDSATRFPSDLFYAVLISPSVTYRAPFLRTQLQYQFVSVDVTTASRSNPLLHGHNLRGGAQALLLGGQLRPFVNASLVRNDVIASQGSLPDISRLSDDLFHGRTFGAGFDLDVTSTTGFGAQYNVIAEKQGDGGLYTSHFGNVGASWWFHEQVALQARYSLYLRCEDRGDGCNLLENQHNYYLTLLGTFGGAPSRDLGGF